MLEDSTLPCGGMSRMRCGSGDDSVVFICTVCQSQHNSALIIWGKKVKNKFVHFQVLIH